MIRCALILFTCILCMTAASASAAAPKEWEFSTPGGNLIGTNDIFAGQGVVIYNDTHYPFISYISRARFYDGYIACEAAKEFFLFKEADQTLEQFETKEALRAAIKEKNLRMLTKAELDTYFKLSSPFTPLLTLLYMPVIFLIMLPLLKGYARRQRIIIASFMVAEGTVISAAALWLVLGMGGLFLTLRFGGYSFNINIFVNLALMLFSVTMIWFMLYLHEEITKHRHPVLVNTARLISFVSFTVFVYWMASVILEPSLPAQYWQAVL